MEPIEFLEVTIVSALEELRKHSANLEYVKIDEDEFIKLPEEGVYLHSKDGRGTIFDCRVYFVALDEYSAAALKSRAGLDSISSKFQLEQLLGAPVGAIRSLKIPSRKPTLPGSLYQYRNFTLKAFYDTSDKIIYVHFVKEPN